MNLNRNNRIKLIFRCMECLLHVAYRLDTQRWQARSAADKVKVNERKLLIQERFREETGLLIDIVKQGHGTTNDGNTARRFFEEPEITADITGIDKELISKFNVLLAVISCGTQVNTEAFRACALETAELFVQKYPWYYMPQSVHKLLIHGADIIAACPLPVGNMTEEAQESRIKDLGRFRENHTRKISR